MEVAHIFISGFVQGVGFRRFVRSIALKNNVTGWVKNTLDKRVEARLGGKKEDIEKVIQLCKKGSFLSEVKSVEVKWEEVEEEEGFKEFKIIR